MNVIIEESSLPTGYNMGEVELLSREFSEHYTGYSRQDTIGDIDFTFSDTVDGSSFTSLIQGHTPGDKELVVADFISTGGNFDPPVDDDFGLLSLEKRKIKQVGDHGDISKIEYFKSYNPATDSFSELVSSRDYTIQYNTSPQLHIIVDEVISWYRRDGTPHPTTKSLRHTYVGERWTKWLVNKRVQIVDFLKHWVMVSMFYTAPSGGLPTTPSAIMAVGATWFSGIGTHISAYVETYAVVELLALLNADTTPWLDNVPPTGVVPGLAEGKTIREFMTDEILY